jgi:hypothetical protein
VSYIHQPWRRLALNVTLSSARTKYEAVESVGMSGLRDAKAILGGVHHDYAWGDASWTPSLEIAAETALRPSRVDRFTTVTGGTEAFPGNARGNITG